MRITDVEVDRVAMLGRLALTVEEKRKYRDQLDVILEYMDKLSEVDVSRVEPMAGPVELFTPLREDRVAPSLSVEEALANAPSRMDSAFRVPKVLD
jgi:aspartyl-tRNA(Asn)/glutamyl-tRNA(Gln) amidotransferase subunit C